MISKPATLRQRRALADLIGLDVDMLPDKITAAEALDWLEDLRSGGSARRAPMHVLDGLWTPHIPGDHGAGVFFWASRNSWWRVPRPPRLLAPGEAHYLDAPERVNRTRVYRGPVKVANTTARPFPGGQWVDRRWIAPIPTLRLNLWRRLKLVRAALRDNALGLPEIGATMDLERQEGDGTAS